MKLTTAYIVSQILVLISYAFYTITYQIRNRKKILVFSTMANFVMGLSYMLLKAYAGVVTSMVAVLRGIVFTKYIDDTKTRKRDVLILLLIYFIIIVLSVFTYDGILSIFPAIATMLYTFGVWQKNTTRYKLIGVLVSLIWIIYNIYVNSIFGIILESIIVIFAIIGIINDYKTNHKLNKSVDIT